MESLEGKGEGGGELNESHERDKKVYRMAGRPSCPGVGTEDVCVSSILADTACHLGSRWLWSNLALGSAGPLT